MARLEPTRATLKFLFALSNNRCAFPGCPQLLAENGRLTGGDVCHIEAAEPGGARYNSAQTDEQRRSGLNLLILCKNHHALVDADPVQFSARRLQQFKHEHESKATHESKEAGGLPRAAETLVEDMIQSALTSAHAGRDIVISVNQSGGQTAHTIVNQGRQPRRLDPAAVAELVERLRGLPPEPFDVEVVMGDPESEDLGAALSRALEDSGWTATLWSKYMYEPAVRGMLVEMTNQEQWGAQATLVKWLHWVGLITDYGTPPVPKQRILIIVGSQP